MTCPPPPQISNANLRAIAALTGAGVLRRASSGSWSLGGIVAADVAGLGSAALQPASAFALTGHIHPVATPTTDGFISSSDKAKLNGIATGANLYIHPTSDGSLHVPVIGTLNASKFLMAGATPGAMTWSLLPVTSVAGKSGGAVTLTKADVGLSNADNTADLAKPISTAQATALALRLRVDASQGLSSSQQAFGRGNLGLGTAATQPSTAFALATHTHNLVTVSAAGFMSATDKVKLDSLTPGGYTPPTGDGNLPVPATGTTSSAKVLTAGSSAGSISWQLPVVQSVFGRTGVIVATKADVGLGNVDNIADLAKPISTAVATALSGKASTTHTHAVATSSVDGFLSASDKSKLDGISPGAQVNLVTSVAGKIGDVLLVAGDVGLGLVDNTADASKPVSTAQAAAISSAVAAGVAGMVKYTSQTLATPDQLQARTNIGAAGATDASQSTGLVGPTLAAASTVNLSALYERRVIQGPGTVTGFTIPSGVYRVLTCDPTGSDTVVLTAGSAIVTPNGLALTLRPGDTVRLYATAANVVRVESFQGAYGSPVAGGYLAVGFTNHNTVPTQWMAVGDDVTIGNAGQRAMGVGISLLVNGANATVLGVSNNVQADDSVGIGYVIGATVAAARSVVIGTVSSSNAADVVAIGNTTTADADSTGAVTIGLSAQAAHAPGAVVIGANASVLGSTGTDGENSVVIGANSTTTANGAVVIGQGGTSGAGGVALGNAAAGGSGVSIGEAAGYYAGGPSDIPGLGAISIGFSTMARGAYTLALGSSSGAMTPQTATAASEGTVALMGPDTLDSALNYFGNPLQHTSGQTYSKLQVKRVDLVDVRTGSFTVNTTDQGKRIVLNSASAAVITFPTSGTLPAGFELEVLNVGAGAITFATVGTTFQTISGYTGPVRYGSFRVIVPDAGLTLPLVIPSR